MEIILAADHRGFKLKEELKGHLAAAGHDLIDVGAETYEATDDYVDFAAEGAKEVLIGEDRVGIFLCGSGHGMDIVANRHKGIRAALCWNESVARQSREHDDANVLVLPADWLSKHDAEVIADAWLASSFSGAERHERRLKKIREVETRSG
ncbi:RpiB/LacA/LacB family sugar-phosphate isomerase [Candidatus Parcubacteria bacterium]|nr:MAG: RpiB/LacA/LacB family sugar-phosphate isomerase [Candidatus Parcubacteria bacterium]